MLIYLFLYALPLVQSNLWSYDGKDGSFKPSEWYKHDPRCRGFRQTPVDFKTDEMKYDPNLPEIKTELPSSTPKDTLSQNGYTVKVKFNSKTKFKLDAADAHNLVADSVHFHWGDATNKKGSEHFLNGVQFPIEGHIVNYNEDYCKDLGVAVGSPTCLYVIGFFYKIVDKPKKPQEAFSIIVNALKKDSVRTKISDPNASEDIDHVQPRKLFPENTDKFFRYAGSLTTPPCTQNVIWTSFVEPIEITLDDYLAFTKILNGTKPIVNNFRPIQKLNGPLNPHPRVVYKSYNNAQLISKINMIELVMALMGVLILSKF